jgi:hypothetical protein
MMIKSTALVGRAFSIYSLFVLGFVPASILGLDRTTKIRIKLTILILITSE